MTSCASTSNQTGFLRASSNAPVAQTKLNLNLEPRASPQGERLFPAIPQGFRAFTRTAHIDSSLLYAGSELARAV